MGTRRCEDATMLRQAIAAREAHTVRGFRHRGHAHVSRIESFSDAVFGFSLTLLVVSLAVPRTFDELRATMAGFPAFAFSFALLAEIWYLQYRFFRRYGLQDLKTVVLNLALLFTVVFFTYPLKFLDSLIASGASVILPEQMWQLFAIYGGGYASVFAIFALLHRHALAKRDELELTPLETFDTVTSMRFSTVHVAIGLGSPAIAFACSAAHAYALAGFAGGMTYPVALTLAGRYFGRRARLQRPAARATAD